MEVPPSMVGIGFAMISLGIVLLLVCFRPIDSEIIKFSHESRRARQLRHLLQHLRARKDIEGFLKGKQYWYTKPKKRD